MKSTGIVRNIDGLGRFVLPKELRTTMGLNIDDSMEFYTDGDSLILRKYISGCHLCGSEKNKTYFKDKFVCGSCIEKLNELNITI